MKTFWALSCGWFLLPEGVPSLQSYKRIPKEEHHISTMFPDLSSSHTCWFLQVLPSQFITLTHVSYLHFFLIKISTINLLGCFMSALANHLHFLTPDLLLSRPLVVKSCYSTGGPMAWVLLPGSLWEMQNLKACPRINKSEICTFTRSPVIHTYESLNHTGFKNFSSCMHSHCPWELQISTFLLWLPISLGFQIIN